MLMCLAGRLLYLFRDLKQATQITMLVTGFDLVYPEAVTMRQTITQPAKLNSSTSRAQFVMM
jgi:hypothetical protein